jgi:hypothetical protein
VFAAGEEVVKLSHSALDRGMFARSAFAGARWVIGRAPGEYDMQDVLGCREILQSAWVLSIIVIGARIGGRAMLRRQRAGQKRRHRLFDFVSIAELAYPNSGQW